MSTVLYQCALKGGLNIDERHNHSIYQGIDYAAKGLDAAVAWGYKDFRFSNPFDFPILISCSSGKGIVEGAIYATERPFDEVEIFTSNEKKQPFAVKTRQNTKLKQGEKKIVRHGVTGYTIEVHRNIKKDGDEKRKRVSKDCYLTFNQVEEVNN